ncbi:MAG: hypothetical protein ICV72_09030, partial [Aldersonia sp.]|nr:hypothetical protein [Aldersonia sp.]
MANSTVRRTTFVAAAYLAIATTGSCGTKDPTPADQAEEQALAKVDEFYAVQAQVDSDPAVSIEQLETVAGGPVLDGLREGITLRRSQNV